MTLAITFSLTNHTINIGYFKSRLKQKFITLCILQAQTRPGSTHVQGGDPFFFTIGDLPIGARLAAATPDKERNLSTRNQTVMNKELFTLMKTVHDA